MIVVVFQRGSVDHFLEMNETNGDRTIEIDCTFTDLCVVADILTTIVLNHD